jgi:hypothetical protein
MQARRESVSSSDLFSNFAAMLTEYIVSPTNRIPVTGSTGFISMSVVENLPAHGFIKLHQDSGMKELIGRFYQSIRQKSPPPIPYREIILTARIMGEIFAQVCLKNPAK